jgi:beta-lactam-binding protein with PASTA domain/tRNA A-37 threonylcarbamoyl transferase component Bud32
MSVDTSTADPLIGAVLDGRYRLDARIARGGMATVYSGFDTRLDRAVAVKVMHATLADDDAFVERFRREAKAAARLSHPSVVAIYDQGEDGGRVYLVMEHVTGRTLRAVLREHGRLPVAEALDVADGVLSALGAAHAAGLVHRDVKPENVLVTDDGTVKVADFGLARAIEATNHTLADGTLLGTVAYLAPEQVETGAADPRADIYALGVVLFEMLTGQVPFSGGTPLQVAYRHVNEDVPAPSSLVPDMPRVADNVVRAATRRPVEERYADAQAMQSAVRRARSALGNADTSVLRLDEAPTLITRLAPAAGAVAAPPADPTSKAKAAKPVRRPRPGRRRRLVLLAIACAVLLVAGLGGWYLGTGRFSHAPDVVGLSPAAAVTRLKDAGLKARTGSTEYNDSVRAGLVSSQEPDDGARLKRGQVVTLHVSLGVRMSTVPALAGRTEAEARAALAKADLKAGTVTRRYDDTVPKDKVVEAASPAGTRIKHGSSVAFVVSDGPAPVAVPDVRGKALDVASRTLTDAGLTPKVVREFSDTVALNDVIDQSPASGGSVPRGTTVTLRVSKGPQTVTVPEVRGDTVDHATSVLRALGLVVRIQHTRGGHGRVVLDQDPQPGSVVKVGTTVTLATF